MSGDVDSSPAASGEPGASVPSDVDPTSDSQRNRSVITKLATAAAANWKITMALWGVVVAIGLVAYGGGLAREGFPPVNLPIVVVDGTYFVDDPATVDADIAIPLQDAYARIDGVDEVQTFSLGNAFAVVVEFDDTFSSPQGAELLEAANPDIGLPDEAAITVRPIDATKFIEVYDLLVTISGPTGASPEELEAQAPDTVRFTRAIKDSVPYEERLGVIEALWQVVLADGTRSDEENSLLRLVASLLGVEDVDSAMARQRVADKMGI